ncbi:MAG: ParB/RepB/Spo0J family partition protein [Gammaproteobacteria bacterium]|nr:ParB/RepB/Spo0J family partition protein [Gammaproteobacteria bacterium]
MAAKKRGLGKGLDALLGDRTSSELGAIDGNEELRFLPIDLIQRGQYQPRTEFNEEALQDLASSIKAQGVVQPILVRPLSSGDKYEIIAGERRWRASQLAGLHEIPVVLRQIDDQTAMCMALIENIQREDLNPLEQAQGLSRLLDEFGMTHEGIADAVGRSRSTVSNMLRLLDLTPKVKNMLGEGRLEMGHARAILALNENEQMSIATEVVKQGLSVRATELLVRQAGSKKKKSPAKKSRKDPDTLRLESELSSQLGASVNIRHSSKGSGVLEIHYNSLDELDGILKHIK